MRKNPLEQSAYIKKEFSNYIKSTFVLKNEKYRNDFHEELERSVLTKGPYLKLELPFEKSKTLNELIANGTVSERFHQLRDVKFDQSLYWHQYESLLQIQNNENVVVTTGTGSGKTEAFLYPIFDSIFKKKDRNINVSGIQAILLYPMNALVNDQLSRLRKLLSNTPEITFGYFTGDTPQEYRTKNTYEKCSRKRYIEENFDSNDTLPPINELLTREEIRNEPPHILITNFSMLEYLLVRPKDSMIINESTMKDWSFMVLDEAHTYRGTKGIEISHLLKRLQAMANKSPQFILTSATLGVKEEDKRDIIEFANKLTSKTFSERGIIFSRRTHPSIDEIKYHVDPNDYTIILNKLEEEKDITEILHEYDANNLFDLLIHDINTYKLYEILMETTTFDNALQKFNNNVIEISENDFTSLIALITRAKNSDKTIIYDVKYHFFVRALEGAFISLDPRPKLEITNRKIIDDMWAFEIGTCKTCNTTYIIGKEYNDTIFRSELDLEENYEFFDDLSVDFYLIKNEVNDQIDDNLENFQEYIVCSKCGMTHVKSQYKPLLCKCGEEYKVELLKVIKNNTTVTNNLTECFVCGKESRKVGIINRFKLGKDQSTALLSQILLQSMELYNNKEDESIKVTNGDIFSKPINKLNKTNKYFKQFLAFSDSRQQASFYALFFQQNQNKFLRKALVLKNSTSEPVEKIIPKIENDIFNNNLFKDNEHNTLTDSQEAYVSLLLELFKADGVNSLEGLGLISFQPNFKGILTKVTEDLLKNYLPKVKKEDLEALLCIFTDLFRTTPAIEYSSAAGLTYEQRKEYLGYRRFENSIKLRVAPGSSSSNVRSLLPVKNQNNNLTKYLIKTFNITRDEAFEYSRNIWNVLENGGILTKENDSGEAKIDLSKYYVYSKNDINWYICSKCKNITPHNINNSCVNGDCEGVLRSCDPDIELKDNYYRNQYINKIIEPIVVQEHTGQLTREEGRKYQKAFMNKDINVLSSSTTFEMGVDIGSLDTVFMRNIPPTNANYAQRAGRAGRSSESVAFIVTYANHNSHDQLYFDDPKSMIDGIIKPPFFKLDNRKITIRHINAYIISMFYRDHDFETSLQFFIEEGYELFKEYVQINKTAIEKSLYKIINKDALNYFKNYVWFKEMFSKNSLLDLAVTSIKTDVSSLQEAEKLARSEKRDGDALSFKKQKEELLSLEIVEGLVKYNVMPGYGFPVNVVPLKIYDRIKNRFDDKKSLERDLSIALSEYAPDSEIIVDKKKYTSRYIVVPKEGNLPEYYYYRCVNNECGKIKLNPVQISDYKCEVCNNETEELSFIEPNLGFVNDEKNKESSFLKPRKTYASEISYLGSLEPYNADLNLHDVILVEQSADDKLLITNENPFFYCKSCGYAELNKANAPLSFYKKPHKTFREHECNDQFLIQTKLGHVIITDVIKMRISLDMNIETAYSTLTAIMNGITNHLQIDSNDINGILVSDQYPYKFSFILYDTTYGGAGNVKQLRTKEGLINVLEKALQSVNKECCSEEVSCPSCLSNYKNRKFHKYLKRGLARDAIKEILNKIKYI